MALIPWTEIEGFHNVKKYADIMPDILAGDPSVLYRGKVKLHGNNAGIQVHSNGPVVAQSRTTELSVKNDLAGFAKWTAANENKLSVQASNHIIFGEWCGPGIQSSVAINQAPRKVFAVFGARAIDSMNGVHDTNKLITDPGQLGLLIQDIPDAYALPWQPFVLKINWLAEREELEAKTKLINDWVNAIEINDPWVEATFGIKGTGEGLVFYPESDAHRGYANYCNLVFKAKGEKHRVIKSKEPAQVNAEVAGNAEQFVTMVLTTARLEQGARAVADGELNFNQKLTGKFIAWILSDVQKETTSELESSGLEWKQVQKAVGDKARGWYLSQTK